MGTTANVVADELKKAILQGRYKGGEALRQEEIAAEYGISRIPLREALLSLEGQGLVVIHPNRGAYVSSMSLDEAREIYVMRIALESAALAQSVPLMTEADLVRAAGLLNEIDHTTDAARWAELNWEFHATLYQPAGLSRLMATLETLHSNEMRYFSVLDGIARFREQSQKDHRELLRICRSRDVARAVDCLTRQLQISQRKLLKALSN